MNHETPRISITMSQIHFDFYLITKICFLYTLTFFMGLTVINFIYAENSINIKYHFYIHIKKIVIGLYIMRCIIVKLDSM